MPEAARALPDSISALPPGTRLGEFEVRGVLGVGGFGIVYRAFDHALEREVAIKEYMPASMAGRTKTLHVSLRSQGDAEVFALGLKSFVNEARLLARFDHPSLIKVHRFWEANGTAYMAMPVLHGPTLKDLRRDGRHRSDEAWIRAVLAPLLGALECLHDEGVYHRDIAPDNIHLERDGRLPVLLDFGAARRVISGKTQSITAILKPAYAPIEQYGETGSVKQGPWTDLYALGATLHYMLMGYPPAPATARTLSGESSGLTSQALPGCSAQLLAIVDWMLAPRPGDRPQSVAELRRVLEGHAPMPHRLAPAPPSRRDASADAAPAITVPLGEVEHAHLELEMTAGPAVTAPAPVQGAAAQAARQGTPRQAEVLRMAADGAHRLRPPPSRSHLLPLALVGAVLAGGLGYAGWTRFAPPGAAVPAASAPSQAGGVANTATATAPTPAPTTDTSPTAPVVVPPTSGIATVSAASGAAAGAVDAGGAAAMPAAAPPAGEARDTTTVIAPAASPAEAPRPRPAEAASPAEAPLPPRAGGTTDPPRPEGPAGTAGTAGMAGPAGSARATPLAGTGGTQARAAPAATARPAQRNRAAPLPGDAAEPPPNATPEGLCKGLSEAAHFVCMERECLRARFRNHPECR